MQNAICKNRKTKALEQYVITVCNTGYTACTALSALHYTALRQPAGRTPHRYTCKKAFSILEIRSKIFLCKLDLRQVLKIQCDSEECGRCHLSISCYCCKKWLLQNLQNFHTAKGSCQPLSLIANGNNTCTSYFCLFADPDTLTMKKLPLLHD